MRCVLDANVLISAVVSIGGAPGELLARWRSGGFEIVVSDLLLDEVARTLERPKLRRRVSASDAAAFVALLRERAVLTTDPSERATRCEDPEDDYLFALAEAADSYLVSGDAHVLALSRELPVLSPREFLELLEQDRGR